MRNHRLPLFKRVLLELQSNCNRDCFFCNRVGDVSGKRIDADGQNIKRSMPSEQVVNILNQVAALGFKGPIAFHHMSEPFLDPRLIDFARQARQLGMMPYEHTNGDALKGNDALCRAAAEVFDYIVVGLYDDLSTAELLQEKVYWRQRLKGTKVEFSVIEGHIHPRTFVPYDSRMIIAKRSYPKGVCERPLLRMIIHYDGNVALCCEDMIDSFSLGNVFEQPVEEIWYSAKLLKIVQDLQNGKRSAYPLCAKCPLPPTSGSNATWLKRLQFYRRNLISSFRK